MKIGAEFDSVTLGRNAQEFSLTLKKGGVQSVLPVSPGKGDDGGAEGERVTSGLPVVSGRCKK